MIYKLKSIELCSNTIGQVAVNLMVDPPREGRESDATIAQYRSQRDMVMDGLRERAQLLEETFNKMHNIQCNRIEGAMYGFPSIKMAPKALERAEDLGIKPDFMYCMDMLKETGIMTVPGSGFGQVEGTHHFRITNLVTPTGDMKKCLDNLHRFNDNFHAQYE